MIIFTYPATIMLILRIFFILTAMVLLERTDGLVLEDPRSISTLRGDTKGGRVSNPNFQLASASDPNVKMNVFSSTRLKLSYRSRRLGYIIGILHHQKSDVRNRVLAQTTFKVDYNVAETHPPKNNR
ncbi:hypothetical protein KP509_06G079300 [Ceratopteris richardii]|uniref:Uncharacterized protein n=1 Tax=Ceratopteris richardii TaxID=49495 RepID=A0A8T2UMJ7_CERRI|nr:hypothetical protein KP509_06G079300 [Ceratopteris richardii]